MMKYIRARTAEAFQSFFGIMVAIIGIAMGLLALYCLTMMLWMMLKILFITTWMSIQAVLWGLGGALCVFGAYALFNGSSTLMRRTSRIKRPANVTIIDQ